MGMPNISQQDIETEFMAFMRANGCEPEGNFTLQMDGQLHRFSVQGDKHGEKTGAYCVYSDGWPAGWCQNWRGGEAILWSYPKDDLERQYPDYFSSPEFKASLERSKQQQAKVKEEQEQNQREAIKEAVRIWVSLSSADKSERHKYILDKQIYSYGLRIDRINKRLAVPIQNINGDIVNIQWINENGKKRFLPFAPVSGNFFAIALDDLKGTDDDKKKAILIGEGVATMSTLYELTGQPCVAAMNCGNLKKVAEVIKAKFPDNPIVIMADNDHKKTPNAGKAAAEEACRDLKLDGVVMPEFADDDDGTDWNDFYKLHDCNEEFCLQIIRAKFNQLPRFKPRYVFYSGKKYLESFFESDMKDFKRYSGRKTGFTNLDGEGEYRETKKRIIPYPGLYALGAVSGLGKSTLALQLADNLAKAGEHVLYFTLEQRRFELVSKSLARLCQPEGKKFDSGPTSYDIRNGVNTPELREAKQQYSEIAEYEYIIECSFDTTVSMIIDEIEDYIKHYGAKPVVFIDYLQLVRSDDSKLKSAKDITDDVIRALKKFQMQNDLLVFVISSLNRENYATTIDFESFKESGSIEYTCDVVMGLQLAVMNSKLFETEKKTKTGEKHKFVKAAKKENPRHMELCILKNRYGVSNESFFFKYYPQWDLFIPLQESEVDEVVRSLINSIPDDGEQRKSKNSNMPHI